MNKKLILTLLYPVACTLLAGQVFAATCTNQYGSAVDCPTNELFVNKTVRHPINMTMFLENITSNNTPYATGAEVEYDIAVTNRSNVNYSIVTVTDTLPTGVVFKSGPGTYNNANRTLTYTIENLAAGATNHSKFSAIIKDAAFFNNADLTCSGEKVNNHVQAVGPNNQTDEDDASICVQTKVLGVSTLPVAGVNDMAAALPFALTALAGLGLFIKGRKRLS